MRAGRGILSCLALAGGLAGLLGASIGLADTDEVHLLPRAYLPALSRADGPPPAPTPRPDLYDGPVNSIYLQSAGVLGLDPLQERDTHFAGRVEYLDDPARPQLIVTYPRFGRPGWGGTNTIFAAHVNYAGYGNGPFAHLAEAQPDDALYVTMGNGDVYTYTVRSVATSALSDLDMNDIVDPALDPATERVTLISCGGTFIPTAVGGQYNSRVIVMAERYVP